MLLVCALAGSAAANTIAVEPDPEAPFHDKLFGFRIGWGQLPRDGLDLDVSSLALGVEHRVLGNLRIAGEYEHLWLGPRGDDDALMVYDGSGHRTSFVVRHHLFRSKRVLERYLRFYVDLEVGGGFTLASDPASGTLAAPHALAGFRLGYDFIKLRRDTRASSVLEAEVIFRAVAMPNDRIGYLVGIGMAWGD